MYTTGFWNNRHKVRLESQIYFFNWIEKISYGHLCPREDNLSFNDVDEKVSSIYRCFDSHK